MLQGPYDIRKVYPYLGYENYQFDIPTHKEGDSYARYLVRMEEMKQSASLVEQALARLKPGPVLTDNRKVALPPRRNLLEAWKLLFISLNLSVKGFIPLLERSISALNQLEENLDIFLSVMEAIDLIVCAFVLPRFPMLKFKKGIAWTYHI